MADRLSAADKKQFERFIQAGPKDFKLLYSFNKHGADPTVFHQLCDNKGPTITVIYNTLGTVYGGYTGISWTSSTSYQRDEHAFLFRLQQNGNRAHVKFPIKNPGEAIYCNSKYGPVFGGGYDLSTFNGTLTIQNDQYTTNCSYSFGTSYDMGGITTDQLTSNIKTITELEVYNVTDSVLVPVWRETGGWEQLIVFGKVFVKDHVFPIASPYCQFGSADGCDIRIKGTIPIHCQLEFNGEKEAFLRCFRPVILNGHSVTAIAELSDTALITIDNKEFRFVKQVQRTNKRVKPEEEARRFIIGQNDPEDLYSKHIDHYIGHGVFAKKPIRNGKFLAEYFGSLLKAEEVQDTDTNYTYFFKHSGVDFCIDATEEPKSYYPSLGRLVNHADNKKQRNSKMQIIIVDEIPHLALFATRDIKENEEIRYDYGVKGLPWLSKQGTTNPKKDLNPLQRLKKAWQRVQTDNQCEKKIGHVQNEVIDRHENESSRPDENEDKPNQDDVNLKKAEMNNSQEELNPTHAKVNPRPDKRRPHQDCVFITLSKMKDRLDGDSPKKTKAKSRQDMETPSQDIEVVAHSKMDNGYIEKSPTHAKIIRRQGKDIPCIDYVNMTHSEIINCQDGVCPEHPPAKAKQEEDITSLDGVTTHFEMINKLDEENPTHAKVNPRPDIKSLSLDGVNIARSKLNYEQEGVNSTPSKVNPIQNREKPSLSDEQIAPSKMHNKYDAENPIHDEVNSRNKKDIPCLDDVNISHSKIENSQDGVHPEHPQTKVKQGEVRTSLDDVTTPTEIINKLDADNTTHAKVNPRQDNDRLSLDRVCVNEGEDDDDDNDDYENKDTSDDPGDISEYDLDDSGADPDYNASSSDESDDSVEIKHRKMRPEFPDYVSDSELSDIIKIEPRNGPVATGSYTDETTQRSNLHVQPQPNWSTNYTSEDESVQKTLVQATTAYREDGRRNVDKKHCCVFCEKYFPRIGRHLQTHNEEKEIKLLDVKSSEEKERILTKLRLDGDYKHNLRVRESGVGFLILPRRPSKVDAGKYIHNDYKPCEICKGFYLRWELWRHMPKCPLASKEKLRQIKAPSRTMWQQRSHLMLEASMPSSKQHIYDKDFMDKIVGSMTTDDISLVVRNDSLIMKKGEELFEEKGIHQKKSITQKMRLLGRLVLKMRKITFHANEFLEYFMKSTMFDFLIEAAKELSGVYAGKQASSFSTPSVAMKIGPLLNECCAILRGRYLRSGDEQMLHSVGRLQTLIDDEWGKKVTAIARRSRQEVRRNKQVLLPKASDLGLLNNYLDTEMTIAEKELQQQRTSENFQRLSSLVLTKLIVFNRRRSGETAKIYLTDYLQKPDWHNTLNEVIMKQLSVLERQLVNRLDMIMIRGKRERNVTVILTPEVKQAINLLVQCRESVGINQENMYLFPRSSGISHIEGHVCLRNITDEIKELEFPERLCSTNLRKFTATIVQMLNLNSGELEWLSNHLGHTVDVHKEFYRNQESAVEMGKIASMLLRLDRSTPTQNDSGSDSEEIDTLLQDVLNENADAEVSDNRKELISENVLDFELECAATGSVSPRPQDPAVVKNCPSKRKADARLTSRNAKQKKIVPWSTEQLAAIKRAFAKNLRMLNVPNKEECENAREKEPSLSCRDWKNIKYRVHHEITRMKKK